ncbi:adenylate cyclase [Acrasis kona]|uniref:Adenylate cyclase n=1 Tax=Acrasis kona TaxID=1008807 RepID=A0AAW2ZDM1_9EUKA
MMSVEVNNFDMWTKERNLTDILYDLNMFLSEVCPAVSIHDGFVDKYNHNGFTAIFRSVDKAVRASEEILFMVHKIQGMSRIYGDMKISIAMHSASVLVGTIGEDNRMDSTIISSEAHFNERLLSINKTLGSNILASSCTVQSKKFKHKRSIGVIEMNGELVQISEIFQDHKNKLNTIKIFEQAVKAVNNKGYYEAIELFTQVMAMDPYDNVCQNLLKMCFEAVQKIEMIMNKFTPKEVLKYPTLRELLHQQCIAEHSCENFDLYELIEEYQKVSPDLMKSQAQYIYHTFCDLDSPQAVNIIERTKINLLQNLKDQDYVFNKDTLNDLMRQMLVNMSDTVNRLVESYLFKKTCIKILTEHAKPLLQ